MIVSVYLVAQPGADRIYVSTSPPLTLRREPGTRVFRADIELPEYGFVDGVITPGPAKDLTDALSFCKKPV
jgi:hypothetical protein